MLASSADRPVQHGVRAAQLSRVDRAGRLLPLASRHPEHSAAHTGAFGLASHIQPARAAARSRSILVMIGENG